MPVDHQAQPWQAQLGANTLRKISRPRNVDVSADLSPGLHAHRHTSRPNVRHVLTSRVQVSNAVPQVQPADARYDARAAVGPRGDRGGAFNLRLSCV